MHNLAIFHKIQNDIASYWKSIGSVEQKRCGGNVRFVEVLRKIERKGVLKREGIGIERHWHLCAYFQTQTAICKCFVVPSRGVAPRVGLQLVSNILISTEVFDVILDIAIVGVKMKNE